MPLGRRVVDIRKGKAYKTAWHKERLDALGFIWEVSEEKFSTLIECIRVYKQMYPEMNGRGIPPSFVIPMSSPEISQKNSVEVVMDSLWEERNLQWPSHMRGYKLGASVSRLLEKIRKGSFDSTKERKLRAALGIDRCNDVAKVKSNKLSDEEMIRAVMIFQNLNNHTCIPSNYHIPHSKEWPTRLWGIRLGSRIADVRRGKSGSEELRSSLRVLGLKPHDQMNKSLKFDKEKPFEDIFYALKAFKELYGHLKVPYSFTVPTLMKGTPWGNFDLSENIAGMRLGLRVNAIRSASTQRRLSPRIRSALNSIGFVWKVSDHNFNMFLCCIEVYEQKYGHTRVPLNFTIPPDEVESTVQGDEGTLSNENNFLYWPQGSGNLNLGRQLRSVKSAKLFTEIQRNRIRRRFPNIEIAKKSNEGQQRDEKNCSFPIGTPFDRFFRALKTFKEIHGHVYVPFKYVVPPKSHTYEKDHGLWPDDCHGYKLGLICSKIRNNKDGIDFLLFSRAQIVKFQHKNEDRKKPTIDVDVMDSRRNIGMELLSTLSFRIISSADIRFQRICKALIVHRRLFGDMDVPRYYVVPETNDEDESVEESWPPECLGMKLGLRVRDIRAGLAYNEAQYQQVLQDIGFFDDDCHDDENSLGERTTLL